MRSSITRAAAAVALAGAAARWMVGPRYRPGPRDGSLRHLVDAGRAGLPEGAEGLNVVSWNIAWAYGWGSEGNGPKKDPAALDATLKAMGERLRALDADVVPLQEVDWGCARSGRVDQGERLARAAGYPYMAPVVGWEVGYLPFPGLNPSGHWGRMVSGGAILSRLPLRRHRVHLLPKPAGNNPVYNAFYIGRYLQLVEVTTPWGPIDVGNLHLDAFDGQNRAVQASIICGILQEAAPRWILAGDFNTVPPEASLVRAFPDEPDTDFSGDPTLPSFRDLPGAVEIVGEGPEADQLTFPAHAPNRRLDHAFCRGLSPSPCRRVAEAGALSDHLPIVFSVRAPSSD